MKNYFTILAVSFFGITSCATTPQVADFNRSKVTVLNSKQALERINVIVDANDFLFLDAISDDLVVISSADKERVVACRIGFGDTYRSAQSKFFFRQLNGAWSVRSEHTGKAGIGSGNSDIVEFKGVEVPCESTGYVESLVFNAL